MSSASSAAVATPLALVRILLFFCIGELMVTSVIAVEAKELEGKQSILDRSIDGNNVDIETECLNVLGEIYHGKCYFFSDVHEKKNYEDAKKECIKNQGELAMFADYPNDGLRIVDQRNTGDPRYWVGGQDKTAEGGWQWENGELITWPIKQPPWGHDEPNGQGHEKCLDILTTGDHHGYNDESCDIEHQYICEIGCSFAGTIYPPGSFIHEACDQLQCNGATGRFDNLGYDEHCPMCRLYGDPHIITFDGGNYDYQLCGNHTLTQNGTSGNPPFAVYGSFIRCTGFTALRSCVDTITLKNGHSTVITVGFQNKELRIRVNDNDLDTSLLKTSPSIVKFGDTDYPVLAWISWGKECLSLQGSSGILVKYCGSKYSNMNSVNVWATPDILYNLKGLCGTPNKDSDDDLTTRDGSKTYTMQRYPDDDDAFGSSWNADTRFPSRSCGNSRKSTESACKTNTYLPVIFQNKCEDAILNGPFTAETNLSQILVDSCVYDLCAATDPVKEIEAVHEAMPIYAHIKDNTVGHCHHKRTHKCKTHKGTCILKTEACDGTIIERGCHGRKCDCCAPSGCEPSPKCLAKQGKCQLLKDAMNCDGIVNSELCIGNKCACCYPEAPKNVKESKQCLKMKGKCMQKDNWGNCGGVLEIGWCKGKKLACCYTK